MTIAVFLKEIFQDADRLTIRPTILDEIYQCRLSTFSFDCFILEIKTNDGK